MLLFITLVVEFVKETVMAMTHSHQRAKVIKPQATGALLYDLIIVK
jgi:hypothetical protein